MKQVEPIRCADSLPNWLNKYEIDDFDQMKETMLGC
jgi:hypothetical protein